ncbi:MAG: polysaccharide deacetylase family protein [Lachnospiraceae bacterium]|jgi:peptidoglycan/xylan/chitin deacetylase (PgdA/CDA1 family)|nr:polysaccharide deacetylase family protein [Lachnospiraceae bacterium]
MKHYDPIFNILYVICVCLTLTAIARPFLTQRAIPAIASSHFHPSGLPVSSIDPVPSGLAPADIRRTALTFDDGPHPVYTEQLLDGLKERGVHATFFVTGEHAELHPDIIRRMHDEGHLIGNHTYSHIQLTASNRDQFKNELIQTNEILYEITGEEIQYVRPPYGSWDKQLETDLNMFPVLWNVDPLDWRTANANRVAKAVISKVSENDIILMHDYYDTSVEAALMIVDELMLQGYEFVTVDKILFD